MFADYYNLPTEYLVDLLAQETQRYTQLLSTKQFNDEFDRTKNIIQNIQAVLQERNERNVSEPGITFTSPDSTQ